MPGGLTSVAVFGLQAWMVVVDLGIDNLCDLYLAMGLPSQLPASSMPDVDGHWGAPTSPGGGSGAFATAAQFVHALERLQAVAVTVTRLLERPHMAHLDAMWTIGDSASDWPTTFPSPPTALTQDDPVQLAQLDALQRCLPRRVFNGLPAAIKAINEPLPAVGNGSHRRILDEWHRRCRGVLDLAAELHGVQGAALEVVQALSLCGFYPAMRVAMDALAGRWAPLAASDLSTRGSIADGWPAGVAARLTPLAACLHRCVWPPAVAHTAGLMASVLLSTTQAEGARFRDTLRLDATTATLLPAGAAPMEAATALASVILTGYAIAALDDGGSGADRDADHAPAEDQASPVDDAFAVLVDGGCGADRDAGYSLAEDQVLPV